MCALWSLVLNPTTDENRVILQNITVALKHLFGDLTLYQFINRISELLTGWNGHNIEHDRNRSDTSNIINNNNNNYNHNQYHSASDVSLSPIFQELARVKVTNLLLASTERSAVTIVDTNTVSSNVDNLIRSYDIVTEVTSRPTALRSVASTAGKSLKHNS